LRREVLRVSPTVEDFAHTAEISRPFVGVNPETAVATLLGRHAASNRRGSFRSNLYLATLAAPSEHACQANREHGRCGGGFRHGLARCIKSLTYIRNGYSCSTWP
jgi:hypothetical protein